jgi:hypothetical protein
MLIKRAALAHLLLEGKRILIAEDEFLIAMDIEASISDAGAIVVGPAATFASALKIAQDELITAAILDVRLGRETTGPIAEVLSLRNIPFVFYTGQALPPSMRECWPECHVLVKPASLLAIITMLVEITQKKCSVAAT